MKPKQIAVVIVVFVTMGYLFLQPVKGLIKPKGDKGHSNATATAEKRPTAKVTVDMVSAAAKVTIGPALSEQINDLEDRLKSATGNAARLDIQKQLAKHWDDVNQPAPAAFYYADVAGNDNKFESWLAAGDHFNDAYKLTQD